MTKKRTRRLTPRQLREQELLIERERQSYLDYGKRLGRAELAAELRALLNVPSHDDLSSLQEQIDVSQTEDS